MAKKDKCETFGNMLSKQMLDAANDKDDGENTHTYLLANMIMNLASVLCGTIYWNLGDDCTLTKAMKILASSNGFETIFLEGALVAQLSTCLTKILKSRVSYGENDEGMNDLMDIEWILQKWNDCATDRRQV